MTNKLFRDFIHRNLLHLVETQDGERSVNIRGNDNDIYKIETEGIRLGIKQSTIDQEIQNAYSYLNGLSEEEKIKLAYKPQEEYVKTEKTPNEESIKLSFEIEEQKGNDSETEKSERSEIVNANRETTLGESPDNSTDSENTISNEIDDPGIDVKIPTSTTEEKPGDKRNSRKLTILITALLFFTFLVIMLIQKCTDSNPPPSTPTINEIYDLIQNYHNAAASNNWTELTAMVNLPLTNSFDNSTIPTADSLHRLLNQQKFNNETVIKNSIKVYENHPLKGYRTLSVKYRTHHISNDSLEKENKIQLIKINDQFFIKTLKLEKIDNPIIPVLPPSFPKDITPNPGQSYKDDDIDGVINEKDICPETSTKAIVLSNGCPLNPANLFTSTKRKFHVDENIIFNSKLDIHSPFSIDMGNGKVFTDEIPENYIYTKTGTYTVRLTQMDKKIPWTFIINDKTPVIESKTRWYADNDFGGPDKLGNPQQYKDITGDSPPKEGYWVKNKKDVCPTRKGTNNGCPTFTISTDTDLFVSTDHLLTLNGDQLKPTDQITWSGQNGLNILINEGKSTKVSAASVGKYIVNYKIIGKDSFSLSGQKEIFITIKKNKFEELFRPILTPFNLPDKPSGGEYELASRKAENEIYSHTSPKVRVIDEYGAEGRDLKTLINADLKSKNRNIQAISILKIKYDKVTGKINYLKIRLTSG